MVTLLKIQILSIVSTTVTNLLGILAFSTDYWSIVIYDLYRLRSHAKFIAAENNRIGRVEYYNEHNQPTTWTELRPILIETKENILLYRMQKGIFRQCNSLPTEVRSHFNLSQCRVLKTINNQYNDVVHGMNNPGRELIRLHNVAASCAIFIVLLLCACTIIGVTVGILNSVVLATMTVGILYIVITVFMIFIMATMYTVVKSERKPSHCYALEILSDQLCLSRTVLFSYSALLGCLLIVACMITSILWLSLQEKQRKFAQH